MSQPALVFVDDPQHGDDLELVVNFGIFAGREATPAEVERLARTLLEELEYVEIVCEQRYEFDREVEATVYRIRVELPPGNAGRLGPLRDAVDAWAQDCIGERRVTP
ncbi:MAG TPA: hypothetical protein VHF23_00650 [Gaiellaceae bacterium]|nr:hypothetical protein [Gaiellaceae bacterium]